MAFYILCVNAFQKIQTNVRVPYFRLGIETLTSTMLEPSQVKFLVQFRSRQITIGKNVVKIDALPQTQRNEGSGAFVSRIRQVIILNQYQGNTEQRNLT